MDTETLSSLFNRNFRPIHGHPENLGPMLRRIVAPNASEMTFTGTNTYVFGTEDLAIIDPGPDDDQHLEAILNTIGTAVVSKILVTQSHLDYTELVGRLKYIPGRNRL